MAGRLDGKLGCLQDLLRCLRDGIQQGTMLTYRTLLGLHAGRNILLQARG